MRLYLIFLILIFGAQILSAQCFDYQNEILNAESEIASVIKNLKKAEKAGTLEDAQRFIDNAIVQAEAVTTYANYAKDYASSCGCSEGISYASTIYGAASECFDYARKAADCGILNELKGFVRQALSMALGVKEVASEGKSYCL